MTEHEPGRELDVMVHGALWPDDAIVVSDFVQSYRRTIGEHPYSETWATIPHYSTDLSAWDWTRSGWSWYTREHMSGTVAVLRLGIGSFVPVFQYGVPMEQEPNRFRAQAFARCLCVLQWAEVEASDAKS